MAEVWTDLVDVPFCVMTISIQCVIVQSRTIAVELEQLRKRDGLRPRHRRSDPADRRPLRWQRCALRRSASARRGSAAHHRPTCDEIDERSPNAQRDAEEVRDKKVLGIEPTATMRIVAISVDWSESNDACERRMENARAENRSLLAKERRLVARHVRGS